VTEKYKGFVFVGERQSPIAYKNGWTWERCQDEGIPRLCAIQLFAALRQSGIDPLVQIFVNLFHFDGQLNQPMVDLLREISKQDYPIVAMGQKVQTQLNKQDVKYIPLIHPAVRGRLRNQHLYTQHVISTLTPP